MYLENFISQRKEEIKQFHKYWQDNHLLTPDEFPLELNDCDWEEQFIVWLSLEK